MNLAPTDRASAHRWERVTFTTYALSLSFFEVVVLDALIRVAARQALILADVPGVRASVVLANLEVADKLGVAFLPSIPLFASVGGAGGGFLGFLSQSRGASV
jgi:hypothetical protein